MNATVKACRFGDRPSPRTSAFCINPYPSRHVCLIIIIDINDSDSGGSDNVGSDVAHMKYVALCHIFISYPLDSVLMTMHMAKCTTAKRVFFVCYKDFLFDVFMQVDVESIKR